MKNLVKPHKLLVFIIILFALLTIIFVFINLMKSRNKNMSQYLDKKNNITAPISVHKFDSDVFYEYLSKEMPKSVQKAKDQESRRGNILAWRWGYVAESCLIAYKNTGEERFLDLFVDSFDEVLKLRDTEFNLMDDYRQRVVNSWGSSELKEGMRINHITLAGRITYPASEFIRIVHEDNSVSYYDKAQQYLNILPKILDEFEEDFLPVGNSDIRYYFRPTTDNLEPINHANAVGNVYVNLYAITKDSEYRKKVEQIAKVFEKNLYLEENDSYSWPYFPKEAGINAEEESELMWKSQITAPFALYAYQEGIYFTETDIKRFANTLKKNIIVDNHINYYISLRDFKPMNSNNVPSRVTTITGWMSYGYFDSEINDLIVDVIVNNPDFFKGGWLENTAMARGYAYLLHSGISN